MIHARTGVSIPQTLAEWCDPQRTALVVYDMQVGICRQIRDANLVTEKVEVLLEAARSTGMRVAFTRHVSLPKFWLGASQLRTAMAWQRRTDPAEIEPWFLPDAEATQLIPELKPRADEAVFDKITMSAFDSTALAFALRDCGLQAIALAGIALEIGIEPTARQAADNGFVAIVIEDACGFGSAEAGERSLATLRFIGDTVVTRVAPFCEALRT